MTPTYFVTQQDFRDWLERNYDKEDELWVGFYKVDSGKPSITWPQSVDQALCFGWIDGIRKSIDNESYCIRFSHRKPKSIWSEINIRKVEELTKQGLMFPAGLAAFEKRNEQKSAIYSYENRPEKLDNQNEELLRSNLKAWEFFQSQPPSYQRTAIYWVMSAKQETTRLKRLNDLIADSEAGLKIKPLRY
ncbi:MAG TPA: YdeI/OmpD-associated family protein [Prolixibacteraceae bacterium]|jgi:uncharacterized protein YdeI (YjbR/CyaY-like superfamily)